jgi:hypothetical protein
LTLVNRLALAISGHISYLPEELSEFYAAASQYVDIPSAIDLHFSLNIEHFVRWLSCPTIYQILPYFSLSFHRITIKLFLRIWTYVILIFVSIEFTWQIAKSSDRYVLYRA